MLLKLNYILCISLDYVNNPEYHKDLIEEVERIHNEHKNLSTEALNKMEKLDNLVKETLRLNRHDGKRIILLLTSVSIPINYCFIFHSIIISQNYS
jgi:hypothetical protein